jgi:hypothetical protein
MTPNVAQTKLDVRGFNIKNSQARERLETVGRSFLDGFAYAAQAKHPADAEASLEAVPANFRGFAYEGAAMAFAIRDALPGGGRRHVADFFAGRGDRHIYMAYVGVGWAMARLPRRLWSTLYAPDPLLRWLVLDGYGFHQAYFKTDRYVYQRHREDHFPWPPDGPGTYATRAIDQGVGRATWFVAGTDPELVVRLFDRFPPRRHADLYAGAGLAATYAGGASEEELRWFRDAAGAHQGELAQGAAFAAGARVRADLVVPHNEMATRVFCGMSVEAASKITDDALDDLPDDGETDGESDGQSDGDQPAYEVWRQRIRAAFMPAVRERRGGGV